MKIIGLDVGEKRIGVAKADSNTRIAVPMGFINVDGTEWDEIARLARINGTNLFVLGLPRSNNGNETKQTLYVRRFAKTLTEKVPGAKIRFQDESLTSVEAEKRLKSRKKAYAKGDIDAEAASIILQDFIENFKEPVRQKTEVKPKASAVKGSEKIINNVVATTKTVAKNTKDEVKKATLKTRKWKFLIIPIVAVVITAIIVGAIVWYKNDQARKRAEYYAELEAAMTPDVFNFTILPGETIFDIKNKLTQVGYSAEEVNEALNAQYDYSFLASKPAGTSLEGYLYGETYEFYKSATAKEIINKFLEGMANVITENGLEAKYLARGLSLYEGITLASIIQKEAPGPEMATVAQVFYLRLNYGMTLGSDVTVTYALNIIDPDRVIYTDNTSALTVDSCYNTRQNPGLPCGPISNPGLTALLAVAEPTDTEYLFFLTGDDGIMYYSYTEAEHNQNAYLHCQTLCSVSL